MATAPAFYAAAAILAVKSSPLSPAGGLIMVVSICSVIGLTVFCLYRVLALPPAEVANLDVAPLDIELDDAAEDDYKST